MWHLGDKGSMRLAVEYCAGPAALQGIAPPAPPRPLPPVALWLARAQHALAANDAEGALRYFETASLHDPRLALIHLGRAVCLSRMEREAEAVDALGATIEAAQNEPAMLLHMARACARDGQAALAMPLLSEAVRIEPSIQATVDAEPLFADHPAWLAATGRL